MKNNIWFAVIRTKARVKEALGLRLSPWEDFLIEIGLY